MKEATQNTLPRSLGARDAMSLVIGTIVGTGIFLKTATMAQLLGSMNLIMLAWILSGILSYAGALTYAELSARVPKSGGEYAMLNHTYGTMFGFLFGWMRFLIGSPGSIAAYGVAIATFLTGLFSVEIIPGGTKTMAVFIIILFSVINCFKISMGARLQTFLTVLKIVLILGLVIGIFLLGTPSPPNSQLEPTAAPGSLLSSFGLAMIAALWAFDGWNNLPMVGGEITSPKKNIPLALGIGMLVVIGLYLLVNWAYFHVLTLEQIQNANSSAHKDALPVATLAAQTFLGNWGVPALSLAFVISALGAMNGSILTCARVPFAMAQDGLFWKILGQTHNTTHVPVWSIIIQALIAIVLALSGTFDQLTNYVVVSSWIFYVLVAASIFMVRKRKQDRPEDFKVPGYPVVPMLFIFAGVFLIANSLYRGPFEGMIGAGIIVAGIPVYFFFKRQSIQLS
ncbi:MAG: amino acid permease [Bdellovibrio sp.]|nr:amino acid permease [Bdellovibrio sp.]